MKKAIASLILCTSLLLLSTLQAQESGTHFDKIRATLPENFQKSVSANPELLPILHIGIIINESVALSKRDAQFKHVLDEAADSFLALSKLLSDLKMKHTRQIQNQEDINELTQIQRAIKALSGYLDYHIDQLNDTIEMQNYIGKNNAFALHTQLVESKQAVTRAQTAQSRGVEIIQGLLTNLIFLTHPKYYHLTGSWEDKINYAAIRAMNTLKKMVKSKAFWFSAALSVVGFGGYKLVKTVVKMIQRFEVLRVELRRPSVVYNIPARQGLGEESPENVAMDLALPHHTGGFTNEQLRQIVPRARINAAFGNRELMTLYDLRKAARDIRHGN